MDAVESGEGRGFGFSPGRTGSFERPGHRDTTGRRPWGRRILRPEPSVQSRDTDGPQSCQVPEIEPESRPVATVESLPSTGNRGEVGKYPRTELVTCDKSLPKSTQGAQGTSRTGTAGSHREAITHPD